MGGGNSLIYRVLYKLALPSLFFSTITYIPKMVFNSEGLSVDSFLTKTIGGYTYWFTSALIVGQLLCWLLLKSKIKKMGFYFLIGIVVTLITIIGSKHDWFILPNYWFYKQGLLCVGFLVLGGMYWKYESIFDKIFNRWIIIAATALYVTRIYLPKIFYYDTAMFDMNIPGLILAMIGCLLFIRLCKTLPLHPYLRFIGDNSIGFYFLCGILPIGFSAMMHKILPTYSWVVWIVFLLSVAAAYPVVWLIKNYHPWMFDFSILIKNHKNKTNEQTFR